MAINQETPISQENLDYLEMFDYYISKPEDFFSNQECLDYISALFWLTKNGSKGFDILKENQKFRKMSSRNNCLHNALIFQNILRKKNFSGEDMRNMFRESIDELNGSGVIPPSLFYSSKKLDAKDIESLLLTENYFGDNFNGFKSKWIREKDNDKRVNYCLYLRENNEKFSPNLKYLVENLSKNGHLKYDLVVSFNNLGINSIKHSEYEIRKLKQHELMKEYTLFSENYKDFCEYSTSFFKEKKDKIQIIFQNDDKIKEENVLLSNKNKVIAENVLKKEPILAGGAFRYILNFYVQNYDKLQNVYNNLKTKGEI